jgi:hypothetical protein
MLHSRYSRRIASVFVPELGAFFEEAYRGLVDQSSGRRSIGCGSCHRKPRADAQEEPPMGKLREGERVLVDDGECPAGQIKEVIGGNHVKVGGTKRLERQRKCIAKR